MSGVFDALLGRPQLNELLGRYAQHPVHAYLYLGPAGSQRETAAFASAAALLCEQGGCGTCTTCQRVLKRVHPDVHYVALEGSAIQRRQLDELLSFAEHRPLEGSRQVAIVPDISGIENLAPVILKTLEEPYPGTFFILLATELTPGMATIASRCTTVQFPPVPEAELVRILEQRGLPAAQVAEVAQASLGSISRAELLVDDPNFLARLALWRSAPERLDGSGAACAALTAEILSSVDAALAPLQRRHAREQEERLEAAERYGSRTVETKRSMEDRHKRIERRYRNDELVAGLGVLQRRYAEQALAIDPSSQRSLRSARRAADAVAAITEARVALRRNATDFVLLDALFAKVSAQAG